MHSSLVDHLVDPVGHAPLVLVAEAWDGDDILEGSLRSLENRVYPIRRGIPRFHVSADDGQEQTRASFDFKWRQQHAYEDEATQDWARTWMLDRYGFGDAATMRAHLAGQGRILDAGCGSGYTAVLWLERGWAADGDGEYIGVDVSEAVDVAAERLRGVERVQFVQADVLQLPFRAGTFGAAFSEGVLHHTPSTERAFASVTEALRPGGELLAYIYRKKGAIREFSDDRIRELVSSLPPEDALAALRPLTMLAKALSETDATVVVPEDVPQLGIPAGEHPIQRLVYWHFVKAFWNDAFTFEGNNLVNFDWYHPVYAHRHTESEVRSWCDRYGLSLTRLDAQESGFTLRAARTDAAPPTSTAGVAFEQSEFV